MERPLSSRQQTLRRRGIQPAPSTPEHPEKPAAAEAGSDDGDGDDDFMIQCDAPNCHKWYYAVDLDPPLDPTSAAQYEVWHCTDCAPYHGPSRLRRRRDGLRKRKRINFVKLNDPGAFLDAENGQNGVATNDVQDVDFDGMIRSRRGRGMFQSGTKSGGCLVMPGEGEVFNGEYAAMHGFDRPVFFANRTPSQIGLRVPTPEDVDDEQFTFRHIAKLVGAFRPVQLIDTATQLTTEMSMGEWVDYLETPKTERTRTLNLITLEFSQTQLGKLVTEPDFARELDFVNLHWPKGEGSSTLEVEGGLIANDADEIVKERPNVAKYCLMGSSGSYTDFHVDFGGTSVWYHVFSGKKIFYFVAPTPKNLKLFSGWATNASRGQTSKYEFLPDLITASGGAVYEVPVLKGQTLFIPSGWIHAVSTPEDSLVFGGNFIHRHSLEMQLGIYRLERQMKVGKEYKFPNYQRLLWYAARDFLEECDRLVEGQPGDDESADQRKRLVQTICAAYPRHVLKGYDALSKELVRWLSPKATRHTIEQYPEDVDVKSVSTRLSKIMEQCVV